jgi:putative tryptophan/tyrosine transport system substrate-binding protein
MRQAASLTRRCVAAWPIIAERSPAAKTLRNVLLTVIVLLAMAPVSQGQQPKTIPRLCFLGFGPPAFDARSPRYDAFFEALRNLGYEDGRSIIIDYLTAEGRVERFPSLAAECLRRKADIIVPATTPAALAAKNTTQTIPIVMLTLGDPVGTGLVDSLARPGGNITGTSMMIPALAAKRLELLREAVPGIARVHVLSYLADPIAPLQVKALQDASRSFGMTLQVHDIRTGADIPGAFEAAAGDGAEGLIVTAEVIFGIHRTLVTELAARHRLPAMYAGPRLVRESGGLMGFFAVADDPERGAASYVDRILKGEKAAELPVQQPTRFQLVVNLKTAKALGLTIPPALLARADEVIE